MVYKNKCYNSGKIGELSPIAVEKKFAHADSFIAGLKYIPISPLNNGLKPSRPWLLHMCVDVFMLAFCEAVFFQSDWIFSRGARIEHRVAKFLNKKIIYHYDS